MSVEKKLMSRGDIDKINDLLHRLADVEAFQMNGSDLSGDYQVAVKLGSVLCSIDLALLKGVMDTHRTKLIQDLRKLGVNPHDDSPKAT